jgi:hypothetical protein
MFIIPFIVCENDLTILSVCKSIYNFPVIACLLSTKHMHLCGQSLQTSCGGNVSILNALIACFLLSMCSCFS